jgi:hypothetical protein
MSNSISVDMVNVYGQNTQIKTPEREKQSITVTNRSQDKKDNFKEVLNDDLFKIIGYLKSQQTIDLD